jgi:hypothetical protein
MGVALCHKKFRDLKLKQFYKLLTFSLARYRQSNSVQKLLSVKFLGEKGKSEVMEMYML